LISRTSTAAAKLEFGASTGRNFMAVRHGKMAVAAIRHALHIAGGTPPEPIGSDLLQVDVHGWRDSGELFGLPEPRIRRMGVTRNKITPARDVAVCH
jgi:hypothetical protein